VSRIPWPALTRTACTTSWAGPSDNTMLVAGGMKTPFSPPSCKFAVEGAKVIVTGRNQAKLDQAAYPYAKGDIAPKGRYSADSRRSRDDYRSAQVDRGRGKTCHATWATRCVFRP
jgi:hypothetical protein